MTAHPANNLFRALNSIPRRREQFWWVSLSQFEALTVEQKQSIRDSGYTLSIDLELDEPRSNQWKGENEEYPGEAEDRGLTDRGFNKDE